jgi:hypothetical protein
MVADRHAKGERVHRIGGIQVEHHTAIKGNLRHEW